MNRTKKINLIVATLLLFLSIIFYVIELSVHSRPLAGLEKITFLLSIIFTIVSNYIGTEENGKSNADDIKHSKLAIAGAIVMMAVLIVISIFIAKNI